jgi:N-hydroxyarylamine O-acetyltransferase
MPSAIDVEAYFARIGHAGPRSSTLETLRELHLRHVQAIPFENLDPLLGRPVRLELPALERKLVGDGRGGYCFEHNLLFGHVLQTLGFRVTGLAARVLWNAAADAITARSHMLLRIDIDGAIWLADVGFGGQTLSGPIRLHAKGQQQTPHEPFSIVRVDDHYRMESTFEGASKALYRFDLQEQHPIDYESANYYLSTHPDSIFRTTLRAARPAPGRRYALLNNQLAIHHLNGPTDKRTLASVAEIRRVLEDEFRLRLPDAPELDASLARFV